MAFSLKFQGHVMIQVTKQLTPPGETEYALIVVTSHNELVAIERIHTEKLANRLPACGIYRVREYFQFQTLVTGFSKRTLTLQNNMLVANGLKQVGTIMAYKWLRGALNRGMRSPLQTLRR